MPQNNGNSPRSQQKAFSTLRQFVRDRTPQEHCEVCGAVLLAEHSHLFEPSARQVVCVCEQCAVSMGNQADKKYRRVPRQSRFLPEFQMSDGTWDSLLIPVGMAFFYNSTPAGKVMAYYPSPAGAMESLLMLETWNEVVSENPILNEMEPDVEALLVYRLKGGSAGTQPYEYYLAPIDKCFELVGLIRMNWKGLSGGTEVWQEIAAFFAKLKANSAMMRVVELGDDYIASLPNSTSRRSTQALDAGENARA